MKYYFVSPISCSCERNSLIPLVSSFSSFSSDEIPLSSNRVKVRSDLLAKQKRGGSEESRVVSRFQASASNRFQGSRRRFFVPYVSCLSTFPMPSENILISHKLKRIYKKDGNLNVECLVIRLLNWLSIFPI